VTAHINDARSSRLLSFVPGLPWWIENDEDVIRPFGCTIAVQNETTNAARRPSGHERGGAPDQVRVHDGDGIGVLRCSSLDSSSQLLPLDLIYRRILPHAFDTPTQAASFCLVCSHFREATSRLLGLDGWTAVDAPTRGDAYTPHPIRGRE
jgi:hypothetical protein